MDKEEILKKSRNEKKDEWSLFVENKAMSWGYLGASVCISILILINLIFHRWDANQLLLIVGQCTYACYGIGRAKYTRNMGSLILCIIILIICVFAVYCYIGTITG